MERTIQDALKDEITVRIPTVCVWVCGCASVNVEGRAKCRDLAACFFLFSF